MMYLYIFTFFWYPIIARRLILGSGKCSSHDMRHPAGHWQIDTTRKLVMSSPLMPPGKALSCPWLQSRLRPYTRFWTNHVAGLWHQGGVIGQLITIADNMPSRNIMMSELSTQCSLWSHLGCCQAPAWLPVDTCVSTHDLSWGERVDILDIGVRPPSEFPGPGPAPDSDRGRIPPKPGPRRQSCSGNQPELGLTSRRARRSQLDSDSLSIVNPRLLQASQCHHSARRK